MLSSSTKLDAINNMLMEVQEAPVSTLETVPNTNVAIAIGTLDDYSRRIQSEEWRFNTDSDFRITPNGDGYIILADDIVSIRLDDTTSDMDLVIREGKLYDRSKQSFIFNEAITVTVKRLLDFEDLPELAREFINTVALRRFAKRVRPDRKDFSLTAEDEIRAKGNLKRFDVRGKWANAFNSPSTSWVYNRRA